METLVVKDIVLLGTPAKKRRGRKWERISTIFEVDADVLANGNLYDGKTLKKSVPGDVIRKRRITNSTF